MPQTILVTGGAGYIGSHVCKLLAAQGFQPVVYDNLSRGNRDFVRWGPLEEGDLRDRDRLGDVLRRHAPTAVMHFAAYAYIGESMVDPGLYYDNNVGGTLSLLREMTAAGIDKLIFSSTCATYGVPDASPIAEHYPQRPINPYGASKLMVERMLSDFDAAHELRFTALRYFNAAGADPDGEIGERHDPEPHVIPLLIEAALGLRKDFGIYGDDYDTPDGTCIRDYIHVCDLADAHLRALRRVLDGAPSTAYNLGNGAGVSVRDLIAAVEQAAGRPITVRQEPRRPGDPPALVGDATRARRELGWTPAYPGIGEIVRTALEWHRREAERSQARSWRK